MVYTFKTEDIVFVHPAVMLQNEFNQVCVQLPTYADNGALHARIRPLGPGRAAVDRYLLPAGPTAAHAPHAAGDREWKRQTDVPF